jgi:hypothetical protein
MIIGTRGPRPIGRELMNSPVTVVSGEGGSAWSK